MENLISKVDELVKWEKLLTQAKTEYAKLKAEFLEDGTEKLETTKEKTITYHGTDGNKVEVQSTDKISVLSVPVLKDILGQTSSQFIKEEIKYSVNAKLINTLAPIATDDYKIGDVDSFIDSLSEDDKKIKVLKKKLKGNFKKDVLFLETTLDIDKAEAEKIAFTINELVNYKKINDLLTLVNDTSDKDSTDVLDTLKKCIIAEENIRLTTSYK